MCPRARAGPGAPGPVAPSEFHQSTTNEVRVAPGEAYLLCAMFDSPCVAEPDEGVVGEPAQARAIQCHHQVIRAVTIEIDNENRIHH